MGERVNKMTTLDWNTLIYMQGHGFYVWLAFIVSYVSIAFFFTLPWQRKRKLKKKIIRFELMNKK